MSKNDTYKYPYYDKCIETLKKESTIIETTQQEITTMLETTTQKEITTMLETTQKEITTMIETTQKEITTMVETTQKEITTMVETTQKEIETTQKEDTTTGTTHSNIIEDTTNKEDTTSDGLLYECTDDDILISKCSIKIRVNDSEKYDFITSNILSSYSYNFSKSLVLGGDGDVQYQLTTLKNELSRLRNNDLNSNASVIDLAECESILKEHYGIAEEDSLIILKKKKQQEKPQKKMLNMMFSTHIIKQS